MFLWYYSNCSVFQSAWALVIGMNTY